MSQSDAKTPHDGQRSAAWVATVAALTVVAAFVAGKAARDAILLSSFDIKMLPVFVGVSAVTSLPIILVAGKVMTRFGPARLMPVLNLISAALAIGEWLLLARYPRPVTIAIFFHLSVSGAVLVSGFWSIINERFDMQNAKRHIGRIGMGATIGGILGGLIAQGTAVYLASNAILLVLAGLQITCATTLYFFGGNNKPQRVATERPGTWFALRAVTRSQLLRNLGVVVVLGAVAAGVLDYVFKADIVARTSKDGLLHSLAIFYTVTSVLSAVVQIAVCGPVIARLGVPRSVAALPFVVTVSGIAALAIPSILAAPIARGAEAITRHSIYRAGYELLFAPLPEADKRPTKLVLDIGAERIGDILGAQLVGAIVYVMVQPRFGLLVATVIVAAVAAMFAMRLPRSYTRALEDSLMMQGSEPAATSTASVMRPRSWLTLGGLPILGLAGDVSPLPLRILDATSGGPTALPSASAPRNHVFAALAELLSQDPVRINRALVAELTPELAPHVVELVARDDVGGEALVALRKIAPRCTGMLVDALLDQTREVIIRRRLPEVLVAGEPSLAAWGLWRGLGDPSFEVRYRCGEVLSRLAASGHLAHVTADEVFETVRRELVTDLSAWKHRRVLDDLVIAAAQQGRERDKAMSERSGSALEHVFTVLGLVLPAEPLRIALHAVQTDDSVLRGTALEYLESILPPDVRAQLWPLLESEGATVAAEAETPVMVAVATPALDAALLVAPVRSMRSRDQLAAALEHAYYRSRRVFA